MRACESFATPGHINEIENYPALGSHDQIEIRSPDVKSTTATSSCLRKRCAKCAADVVAHSIARCDYQNFCHCFYPLQFRAPTKKRDLRWAQATADVVLLNSGRVRRDCSFAFPERQKALIKRLEP
jgi:hypothetical protein